MWVQHFNTIHEIQVACGSEDVLLKWTSVNFPADEIIMDEKIYLYKCLLIPYLFIVEILPNLSDLKCVFVQLCAFVFHVTSIETAEPGHLV